LKFLANLKLPHLSHSTFKVPNYKMPCAT